MEMSPKLRDYCMQVARKAKLFNVHVQRDITRIEHLCELYNVNTGRVLDQQWLTVAEMGAIANDGSDTLSKPIGGIRPRIVQTTEEILEPDYLSVYRALTKEEIYYVEKFWKTRKGGK